MDGQDQWSTVPRRLFGVEAIRFAFGRSTLLPALLLLVLFIGSGLLALHHPYFSGAVPALPFLAALVLRVAGTYLLSAAILRRAVGSRRRAWMPDGAFWLFVLLFTISLAVPAAIALLVGNPLSVGTNLIMNGAATLFVSPCAPWIVAAASERPLAWQPGPWLRRSHLWLPQRTLWALLLLVPLGLVHVLIGSWQTGFDRWFWALGVADALAGFLGLMLRLGLDAAAYSRVAQD